MDNNLYLLARIVEHSVYNIMVIDLDGRISYVNRFAAQTLGLERDLIRSVPVEQFLNATVDGMSWQAIQSVLLQNGVFAGRLSVSGAGGEESLCDLDAFRIDGESGAPVALVVTFRDVAREARDAEQIERKNIEMAKMNTELNRSNADLMRISEMKSNFLSIASHELKTPLTSIKGYSDIIIDTMKDKLDPSTYKMVESINRAADRLHRVVNNILDVTRIEQKRLKLRPENLDLGEVATDCIEDLAQFSQKRGIVFECTFNTGDQPFFGDKMRMQQVFTNLFSNALKYSPDNSVVQVNITHEEPAMFHIVVKDHGIGIDPAEQKRIFYPFYEVGNATRHSTDLAKFMGGGTGLGLSIVKGIVERHGGSVWVLSDGVLPDSFPGSEFHVRLPVRPVISWDDVDTRPAVSEGPSETAGAPAVAPHVDEKQTILLIDSDREATEITRMVLGGVFDVLVAETGEAGLCIAYDRHPSLILLDSYLPGLDGYRICRILRSQDETRDIPIAFFSAGTQNDEIQKCFACGAVDFIVKPFSGKELVEKIWRLLMRKKAGASFG